MFGFGLAGYFLSTYIIRLHGRKAPESGDRIRCLWPARGRLPAPCLTGAIFILRLSRLANTIRLNGLPVLSGA